MRRRDGWYIIITVIVMKTAFAGFDLMAAAFETLLAETDVIRLFTCEVDGDFETNSRVTALAARRHIPYTEAPVTPEDIEALIDDGCELLVSAGYYHRIPVDSRLKTVNIHPSLLPYGRGAWPMPLAILDRLPESGVTIHKTEERFDSGDILLQERFALAPDEDLESFMDKVNARIPDMLCRLTAELQPLWDAAQPQGEGVYQREPRPEDYPLSRHSTPEYADRVLRAFRGYYAVYDDGAQRLRIRRGRVVCASTGSDYLPLESGTIEIIQFF